MTNYRVTNGGAEEEISVQPSLITISTSYRGTSQGGGATTLSHADFLAGSFNDHVRQIFGEETLAEVLAQCVDASDDPFGGAQGSVRTMLEAWSTVPIDASLETMAATADAIGSNALRQPAPGGATIATAGATLRFASERGVLTRPDGSTRELNWRCPCSAAMAVQGRFFLTACDHAVVFDTHGDIVLSTEQLADPYGIGTSVRLGDLIRVKDSVAFGYWTMASQADPIHRHLGSGGAIRLDDQGRIIARAAFEPSVVGNRRAQLAEHV